MKCQKCVGQASYHITDIHRDPETNRRVWTELHLCDSCARKHLEPRAEGESEDDAPSLINKMAQELAAAGRERDVAPQPKECPVCGATFADFRQSGRLGCPHDYEVFHDELMPLLETIHGRVRHDGKAPRRAPEGTKRFEHLIQMRAEMKKAIQVEDYETAARLRDSIRAMEEEFGNRRRPSTP